jgi:hypothetical protein
LAEAKGALAGIVDYVFRDARQDRRRGPCLWEHNAEVFRGLLRLQEAEYESPVRDGVIRQGICLRRLLISEKIAICLRKRWAL